VTRYFVSLALPFLAFGSLIGCAPSGQTADSSLTFEQAPIDASGLVGATPQVLNAEFGQPSLRRVDGPAQVWLYHSAACGLNLILYPDSSGIPRVAMAAPTADSADPASCTTALQHAHVDAALEHPTTS
jgi:hypothetical protein